MNFSTANKYLFTIYRRLAIKFDQYLQHITIITDIDECKNIFSKNSSTIMGSKKYGIYFSVPGNIADLFDGKVGEMTSEHVTGYYGNAIGCEILQTVEYMEFKCDTLCNLITYPSNLPQLCEDIPPNTIRADGLVRIKEVLTYYKNFYHYLAKKYYCFSEKSYEDYCKVESCCEYIKYCSENKKCCCHNKKSCCESNCKVECEIEYKVSCGNSCKSNCDNSCKSSCKKCDCNEYKKNTNHYNNWVCRKK